MRSAIHEEVWEKLEDANVEIAYPHTHLMFDETSDTERVAVDRAHADPSEVEAESSDHAD